MDFWTVGSPGRGLWFPNCLGSSNGNNVFFCFSGHPIMIVTEFMANGSLDTFLRVSILVVCLTLYTNVSAKFEKDMLSLYTNFSASLKMINCIYTHSQVLVWK